MILKYRCIIIYSSALYSMKDLLAEQIEMINICRLGLIHKNQHYLPSQNFLHRTGNTAPPVTTAKCIFGFNLEKDGCLEKASYNCEDCDAYCCGDFHRIHSTHNAYADSSSDIPENSSSFPAPESPPRNLQPVVLPAAPTTALALKTVRPIDAHQYSKLMLFSETNCCLRFNPVLVTTSKEITI